MENAPEVVVVARWGARHSAGTIHQRILVILSLGRGSRLSRGSDFAAGGGGGEMQREHGSHSR